MLPTPYLIPYCFPQLTESNLGAQKVVRSNNDSLRCPSATIDCLEPNNCNGRSCFSYKLLWTRHWCEWCVWAHDCHVITQHYVIGTVTLLHYIPDPRYAIHTGISAHAQKLHDRRPAPLLGSISVTLIFVCTCTVSNWSTTDVTAHMWLKLNLPQHTNHISHLQCIFLATNSCRGILYTVYKGTYHYKIRPTYIAAMYPTIVPGDHKLSRQTVRGIYSEQIVLCNTVRVCM